MDNFLGVLWIETLLLSFSRDMPVDWIFDVNESSLLSCLADPNTLNKMSECTVNSILEQKQAQPEMQILKQKQLNTQSQVTPPSVTVSVSTSTSGSILSPESLFLVRLKNTFSGHLLDFLSKLRLNDIVNALAAKRMPQSLQVARGHNTVSIYVAVYDVFDTLSTAEDEVLKAISTMLPVNTLNKAMAFFSDSISGGVQAETDFETDFDSFIALSASLLKSLAYQIDVGIYFILFYLFYFVLNLFIVCCF